MTGPSAVPGTQGSPPDATAHGPTGLDVIEYTDPLCPWAWGSEPKFRRLRALFAGRARWRPVYAVMFDEDEDDPVPDPAAETAWYARFVEEVGAHTGAPYAARLRRVAASSRPASLAAVAAADQGPLIAESVLRRLRETMFVLGDPADTEDRVRAAVRGLPGLDSERLRRDLAAPAARRRLARDHAEARRPPPEVMDLRQPSPHPGAAKPAGDGHRYALPTLVFVGPAGRRVVPGWRPLAEYVAAARAVAPEVPLLGEEFGLLTPEEALTRHGSLTVADLELLTGGRTPPAGAVTVSTGNGPLWLGSDYARGHPALGGTRVEAQ
ncbi:DsbA family protein [Yinghuangia sp. ASG 101]|uniref:DsbA family protein n=1 Tax=Yinghuangia sp. ASG 101 TaxID=2896848 RepID=UPI001E57A208|nr:DsbA family protein [Yinghuangia sp. ASG 101]UGQ12136.1 DsbA family protein [Yinghuangia sp. ASG 101]